MFKTNREVEVRSQPSFGSEMVGKVGANIDVNVVGTPVTAEGWIWHNVEGGGNLWIPERPVGGNDSSALLTWVGSTPRPVPAGAGTTATPAAPQATVVFPKIEGDFTNKILLQAFTNAATTLGQPNMVDTWLQQAGIPWIKNVQGEFYEGLEIEKLPNLTNDVKFLVIQQVNTLKAAQPASAPLQQGAASVSVAPEQPKEEVKKGFSIKDGQFHLNGKPFKFVGVNMRELAWYGFPGSVTQYAQPHHQDIQLDVAKEMRARVVRMYAPFAGSDAQEAVKRLKVALDKLEKRGMYALITLDDSKGSGFNIPCDGGRYRVPHHYNAAYFREGYKQTWIPFVKTVVSALKGHNAVFAWGICNEAQVHPHPPQPPDDMLKIAEEFYQFFKFASGMIRDIDSDSLITTSIESSHHVFVEHKFTGKNYADKLYTLPTIDFATIHSYRDRERYDHPIGHRAEEAIEEAKRAKRTWKKPIIMEELGPVGGFFNDLGRSNGGEWVAGAMNLLYNEHGYSGVMQWGFQGTDDNIGAGDADSGMHKGGGGIPTGDWGSMFNAYKSWGAKFWP